MNFDDAILIYREDGLLGINVGKNLKVRNTRNITYSKKNGFINLIEDGIVVRRFDMSIKDINLNHVLSQMIEQITDCEFYEIVDGQCINLRESYV